MSKSDLIDVTVQLHLERQTAELRARAETAEAALAKAEDDLSEAQQTWPVWAERLVKFLRAHGYYDSHVDDISLPDDLEEWFNETIDDEVKDALAKREADPVANAAKRTEAWRYSINYGPEGEANYAFVYDGGGHLVSNLKIHHAIAVVEQMNARAAQAERMARLERQLRACQWYWPEDDTSSETCADSAQEVVQNAYDYETPEGGIVAIARGGVVEVTYCAYLPPADDSDSDDDFWVEEETREAAKAKIDAELARRAFTEQSKEAGRG